MIYAIFRKLKFDIIHVFFPPSNNSNFFRSDQKLFLQLWAYTVNKTNTAYTAYTVYKATTATTANIVSIVNTANTANTANKANTANTVSTAKDRSK